jgi:hypothetical protein
MLMRITEALADDGRAGACRVTVRNTDEGLRAQMETRPEAVLLSAGGALSPGLVRGADLERIYAFRSMPKRETGPDDVVREEAREACPSAAD